jgi:hypothetical protein
LHKAITLKNKHVKAALSGFVFAGSSKNEIDSGFN